MRKLFLYIFILLIVSCDKFPDPGAEYLENYSFLFQNEHRLLLNENDTVKVTLFQNLYFPEGANGPFTVIFKVVKGGGSINTDSSYIINGSIALTSWKLGSEECEQILRADIYNSAGKYLTSNDLTEYALRKNKWDTFPVNPGSAIAGLVADTVNKLTFMIEYGKVYKQGELYYLWDEVVDEDLISPVSIYIDSNQVLYVSTWTGDVVKSTDHGQSWIKCTRPFPEDTYSNYLYVSNDNYLWASKFGYPARYSPDGGQTWINAGNLLESGVIDEIYRLRDGSLLLHGTDCCSLTRTDDYGITRQKIETPGYSLKLFVNDKDEIFIGTQEEGWWATYKSSDMGNSFEVVNRVRPTFNGYMGKIFNKWNNFYYVLVQGYGILKSFDLVHYETFWYNENIENLYVDHNGVLIASTLDGPLFFRKNSD